MPELGLFPLGVVLLPTERMPLHVFEERYRELVGECLNEEREFGLVYADDDGLREVGTRAAVVDVLERYDDGRLDVVVAGGERFRVVERTSGRSFRTAEVAAYEDDDDAGADDSTVARAFELFRRLAALTGAEVEEPAPGVPLLSFELAGRFELAPPLKQRLLELRSERERLRLLANLLEAAAEGLAQQRRVAELAARNGQVHRRG